MGTAVKTLESVLRVSSVSADEERPSGPRDECDDSDRGGSGGTRTTNSTTLYMDDDLRRNAEPELPTGDVLVSHVPVALTDQCSY